MSHPWRRRGTQGQYNPSGAGSSPPSPGVQQTGSVPLVVGQQGPYAIAFSPAFASAPSFVGASVLMASSSGETFEVALDLSSLTASGVNAWLSGVPTAASTGAQINWIAAL